MTATETFAAFAIVAPFYHLWLTWKLNRGKR